MLTAGEADYIVENSGTKLLVSSPEIAGFADLPRRDGVTVLTHAEWHAALAADLIAFSRAQLSSIKCPRSIDFDPALPRLDNGKLYKRLSRIAIGRPGFTLPLPRHAAARA